MIPTSLTRTALKLLAAVAVVLTVATAVGCADLSDPAAIEAHPAGWVDAASSNFHGKAVLASAFKAGSCATCHGDDYTGGTSGAGCSSSKCHEAYPHPEAEFMNPQSAGFHGKVVLGLAAKELVCATCHGGDFAGGKVGQGCYDSGCHDIYPHTPVFGGQAAYEHPAYVRETTHWELSTCTTCHGGSYDGKGVAAKNCLTCHTREGGPEACDTCHGNGETGAPPPDLLGRSETSLVSVGAHAAHTNFGPGFTACENCHNVPATYSTAGHVDGTFPAEAEVVFGSVPTHNGAISVTWTPTAATCANSWCHGNFSFSKASSNNQWIYSGDTIAGTPQTVKWTEVGTGQAECGSCHGLPPEGHKVFPRQNLKCGYCHPTASTVEDFVIVDPSLHANGQADVY